MKAQYAKITIQVMLVSLLAFLLVGCGESGSPGGDSGIGQTAAISMASGDQSLPADGKTATTLTLNMTDSVGNAVDVRTSVRVHTNLGHFRNGEKEYKLKTIDDSGALQVAFRAGTTPGTAEIWAESNDVKQKVEVMLYDPDKVGSLTLETGAESVVADGSSQVG
ncbi:MAG TPA: invasin domain 3-containing protein, partial [Desulfosalsimonadaceae bacterium]|nr:invasin domain 3-containing protein [Desulfosalsimonadaceae bacterium]